jgi:hypothetical protein
VANVSLRAFVFSGLLGALGISAVVGISAASAQTPAPPKVFTWRQLLSGDCVMVPGAQLVLRPDGTGDFSATTYTNSTHSGDVWHHVIEVTDADGRRLFLLGPYDSPRMNDGSPPPLYRWHKTFTFSKADFARAASAGTAFYSC